ncbi:neutral amino acid transporter [Ophiostoma piceae UAMH 11346]|uniref:Neutral amino acid transporter n=1 Tax=Ophiostoma piceae (strain UAMH 11346) TaxID=1262450 RepID=S3BUG3_OPHP1|nr:neutral amino acid transporter [Ophiostoma piceae UAMH 11346]
MAPQVVQRISVRWMPDPAYEDSDTIAINVGGYFIDLRVSKDAPHALQWSRSGERITLKSDPPTFCWTHIIDSLGLTVPDDAHFEKLPNGDDLEIGVTPAPHKGGELTAYEEVWRDVTAVEDVASGKPTLSWILQSIDGTVFIGKAGHVYLAIHKSSDEQGGLFSACREDYDTATGARVQKYACTSDTAGTALLASRLPTATQAISAIQEVDASAAGQEVTGLATTKMTTDNTTDNSGVSEKVAPAFHAKRKENDICSKGEVHGYDGEVFRDAEYRSLGWVQAGVILMKLCFTTGVLTIPSAFAVVGYVPGILLLVGWSAITTYYAYIMYAFRMRHPGIHSIADAAALLGGPIAREVASFIFLLTWVLAAGSGFIGLSQGFRVLSSRHICNVVWVFVAALCTAVVSSVPTLGKLTILTWVGFASIFTAVFIVVVGVTQVDRPAAAPKDDIFNMIVTAVGSPAFVPGLVAAINLFAGFGSTPTFITVIAEMRHPRSFIRSLFSSQALLVSCYVAFGVVIYVYCGQYVASPSLASAGGTIEKVAFGIAIPGFIMTSTLWVHLAAKFLLVRILRNSEHLQARSLTHWAVWFGSTIGISAISFIIAGAVPFFSYLIGLIGSLCCAPTCLIIPAWMGLYMERKSWRSSRKTMAICGLHIFTVILGSFITIAGTYTTIKSITDAYSEGAVGSAFSCS